ncbi:MAG: ABC transporter permease [Pygmaiobacter sp.]
MRITDLISLCFENLRRRKGRTALTVIGVVVGTCSIVVMVSLGIAMNVGFDEMIQGMGDLTKIDVYNWGSSGKQVTLNDKAIAQIAKLDHVSVATPIYQANYLSASVIGGKGDRYKMETYNIVGMYPKAIEALQYELTSGHYLKEGAGTGEMKKIPVLVGQNSGYGFMDTKRRGEKAHRWPGQMDAQGKELPPFVDVTKDKLVLKTNVNDPADTSLKSLEYELSVSGVMLEDYQKGYVTSSGIIMDLNTLKRLEAEYMKANKIKDNNYGKKGYDNVTVKVDDIDNVTVVEKAIKELGFSTNSMNSWRDDMQKQSQTIQMVLGGLGAVSLFVAALSIVNTMTMAIYERTREIGVMKVLGCGLNKIREMFLIEAGMIGFMGGVIGIAVSYTLSFILNHFGPMLMQMGVGNFLPMFGTRMSVIPPWLAISGIVFSTIIGVLAGIAPSNRAVQISALEAIRHE